MKFYLNVNQAKATELGITNINMAIVFDLLMSCSTWAKPEMVGGELYYFVARQKVCDDLPLMNFKPDTVYRYFKKLADLGLIEYVKNGKKDCVRLTEKGRSYYVGNESELPENTISDTNPSLDDVSDSDPNPYVGNESENGEIPMSDSNPRNGPNSDSNPEKLGFKSDIYSNYIINSSAAAANAHARDPRERFAMFADWVPDVTEDQIKLLEHRGMTPRVFEDQLNAYRLALISSPGDQRTQSHWSRAFFATLNRRCNEIQNGKTDQEELDDYFYDCED